MPYQLPNAFIASALVILFACDTRRSAPLVHGTEWTELNGEVSGPGQVTIESPGVLVISSHGPGLTSVTRRHDVPARYALRFRQRIVRCGAAQGMTVHDGEFRAHLTFSNQGIFASNRQGASVKLRGPLNDQDFHDYELLVHGATADLRIDGALTQTFELEPDVTSDRIEHWVEGPAAAILEIDGTALEPQAGYLVDQPWQDLQTFLSEGDAVEVRDSMLMLRSTQRGLSRVYQTLELDSDYEATFSQRVLEYGDEHGFAVYDGEFRAVLLFRSDGVHVRENDGSTTLFQRFRDHEPTQWHQYSLQVRRILAAGAGSARAQLYVDGVFAGEWNLERDEGPARIEHWLKGPLQARQHVDYTKLRTLAPASFSFVDRFSQAAGESPSDYWLQTSADDLASTVWKIGSHAGGQALESPHHSQAALALLHVFARDVKQFSGSFLVEEASEDAGIWFNLRRNDQHARVAVHLSLADGVWSLLEQTAENRELRRLATHSAGILPAGLHTFSCTAEGEKLTFALDGQTILSSDELLHQNYGRIGLEVLGARVLFDDVLYEGDARVERGVREGVKIQTGSLAPVQSASTGLMRQLDGTVWLTNTKQTCFLSHDGGLTFRYDGTLSCGTNLVELSNSGLLGRLTTDVEPSSGDRFIYRELSSTGAKCRAHDLEKRVQECWSPTSKRALFPDAPRGTLMPGKLTQATSGRVLVAAPEPHGEGIGGMRVYYSDDFRQWKRSRVVLDMDTFGIDLEAGKVVEIADAHFKLFMRTDRGALFESESHDGGASWTAPARTVFRSPRADFNVERDAVTGYHYMLWQYDDPNERRQLHEDGSFSPILSRGRSRLGLAMSRDGTRSWQFLMTLDDWEGHGFRHMNPSLLVHDGVLLVAVARRKYDGDDFHPDVHDLAYFRVDVRGASGSPLFPGTH